MSILAVAFSSFEFASRNFITQVPGGIPLIDWADQAQHGNWKGGPLSAFPTVLSTVMASGIESSTLAGNIVNPPDYATALAISTQYDNQSLLTSLVDPPKPQADIALFLNTLAGDATINSGTFLICQLIAAAPERYADLTANLPSATKTKILQAANLANLSL